MVRAVIRTALVALVACSHAAGPEPTPPADARARTLTIIGTSDLHGALERLPLIAGYVANVRAARAADGGGVLLVDGGDLFQGTLESNLAEGADVVRAYNRMGYAASALGNHEFDYGPVGPAVTAKDGEDPRGALKARIAEAKFPFLVTDIADDTTNAPIAWPNTAPSTMVDVAGIKVGIVGASTESTPYTTMPANFKGLHMMPAAAGIEREAKALRGRGAQVIVVIAHIGAECRDLHHHDDTSSCDRSAELFHVIDVLPKGLVDVFVAGHTHAAVAHVIRGVATIESYSSGRAFGRVDLRMVGGHVENTTIFEPELPCPLDEDHNAIPLAQCHPHDYEGKPVVADADVQKIVDEAIAHAGVRRDEKLGVTLAGTITKAYGTESAEGDLVTELMLAARPDADVAMTNGGGLRQDLPAGELTYGQLFAAMPFDNRFALVDVTGKQLRKIVKANLGKGGGILSWAGLTARARCKDGQLDLSIAVRGKPIDPAGKYVIATSDFLASGGDAMFGKQAPPVHPTDIIIRDAVADVLRARKGTIDPAQFATKRLDLEHKRPIRCGKGGDQETDDD
jgi:5'-nucleotidase